MVPNAAMRPKNNANPSWGSKNNLYCVAKSAILSVEGKFHCIAKIILGAMLIGFGNT